MENSPGEFSAVNRNNKREARRINAKAIVGMNQTFASFLNYGAFGILESHIGELLYDSEETLLEIPLSMIKVQGVQNVKNKLVQLYQREKGSLHLFHTAAYRTDENGKEAQGNWNTYTYRADSEDEAGRVKSVRYQFCRITVDFKKNRENHWLIKKIYVLPLLKLAPWQCDKSDVMGLCQINESMNVQLHTFSKIDPNDFVKIRNLAGMFTHYVPTHQVEYFDTESDIKLEMKNIQDQCIKGYHNVKDFFDNWKVIEENVGYNLHKMTLTNPVISYMSDCDHAELSGLSHTFDVVEGDDTENVPPMVRRVCYTHMTFIRRAGIWKICSVETTPLLSLNKEINEHPRNLEAMPSRVPEYYPNMDMNQSALQAEDVFEIESILPEWTERLKRGVDMPEFPDHYMVNSKEEIRLSMRQVYQGYEAVVDRCDELINRQVKGHEDMLRFPQFHSGCTPVIVSDGQYGQGIWDDICWGNIGAAIFYEDSQKEREYLPGVGQYTHHFVKDESGWKIYSLADRSSKVPQMVDWKYNTDEVGGWAAVQIPAKWPLPFEK